MKIVMLKDGYQIEKNNGDIVNFELAEFEYIREALTQEERGNKDNEISKLKQEISLLERNLGRMGYYTIKKYEMLVYTMGMAYSYKQSFNTKEEFLKIDRVKPYNNGEYKIYFDDQIDKIAVKVMNKKTNYKFDIGEIHINGREFIPDWFN